MSGISNPEPGDGYGTDGSFERVKKLGSLLEGKEKDEPATGKEGPLELLDLPLDVLKCIIKEVTHTNDLTSLALTSSALNHLAIPHIYSRFDIVWPDAHSTSEPRNGVDALTYGLATLVMREDLFNYVPQRNGGFGQTSCCGYTCNHCGMANDFSADSLKPKNEIRRPRRGNLFSQYTRKFSLGNGPADWVQEYLISKEGGKMLGTLIALTIARMPNLEIMVWDMPTGIVREVWHALGSLGDQRPGHQPRLEKVWVRLHDNREILGVIPGVSNLGSSPSPAPLPVASSNADPRSKDLADLKESFNRVEHPNFSILPALKSLSVLEVDELAYLKELSTLIHRSHDSLRELRIGLSKHYSSITTDNPVPVLQDNPRDRAVGCYCNGGVLGLVMSEIFDCRKGHAVSKTVAEPATRISTIQKDLNNVGNSGSGSSLAPQFSSLSVADQLDEMAASVKLPNSPDEDDAALLAVATADSSPPSTVVPTPSVPVLVPSLFALSPLADPHKQTQPSDAAFGLQVTNHSYQDSAYTSPDPINTSQDAADVPIGKNEPNHYQPKPLKLEMLELERIPLSVAVLQKTVDWSLLTTLTILGCGDHECLWKALRRAYTPRSTSMIGTSSIGSLTKRSSQLTLRRTVSSKFETAFVPEYRLKLKNLYTDSVSPALISFLKETLAPNSLECMLLQEHGQYVSPVTIEAIYRGPMRHHRSSLKKILIDSSDNDPINRRNTKWKKWMITYDILNFITSGKMSSLRELGISLDHKDWHFFLQRLPNIPHLRSLYIPHIANHSYDHPIDARELAVQTVDLVIALRPEIELCYMAILNKCFEILENRKGSDSHVLLHESRNSNSHTGTGGVGDSDEDSEDTVDDDHDEDEDNDSDNGQAGAAASSPESEDTESEAGDSVDDSDDELLSKTKGRKAPRFKLREILFYDDKISIFKARHGRL